MCFIISKFIKSSLYVSLIFSISIVLYCSKIHSETKFWAAGSTIKIRPETPVQTTNWIWSETFNRILIKACKNEWESFQVCISNGNQQLNNVTIEVSSVTNEKMEVILKDNVKIYMELFLNVTKPSDELGAIGLWPDPLLPYTGASNIAPNTIRTFFIKYFIPVSTSAGDYYGTVTVKTNGIVQFNTTLIIKVWDFAISDERHLLSALGVSDYQVWEKENIGGICCKTNFNLANKLKEYYKILDDARLNVECLFPFWPTWNNTTDQVTWDSLVHEMWDYTFKNLHFKKFRFPFEIDNPINTNTYPLFSQAYNQKVSNYIHQCVNYFILNDYNIKDHNFFHLALLDEIYTEPKYEMATNFANLFNSIDDRLRMHVGWILNLPSYTYSPLPPTMVGKIEHWALLENTFESNRVQVKQRQLLGDCFCVYPAVGPKSPYVQLFTDHPAIDARIMPWMNWKFNVQFLYWQVCHYEEVGINVWTDPLTFEDEEEEDNFANGDGVLIYPGALKGLSKPQPSLRLELLREGCEDFEYLYYLASLGGEVYAKSICDTLFTKYDDLIRDENKLYQARENIANQILNILYGNSSNGDNKNALNKEGCLNVIAAPNPFIPSKGRGSEESGITFYNVPQDGIIKIYTINGQLIITLQNPDDQNKIRWNVQNKKRKKIASGIYLCLIRDGKGNKQILKIGIIR